MRRAALLVGLAFFRVCGALAQQPLPPFSASDSVVIVAPHPDDEILGCGGVIQHALAAGADVRVIYLTNGDHNQIAFKLYRGSLYLRARHYLKFGELRRREATQATGSLGLPPEHLVFLGYPDWGMLRIWRDYWEDDAVFESDSTRASAVPYKNAYRFGQPYKPQSVVSDFVSLFRELRPTKIFVTHPADTSADHRAAANFVRLATLEVEPEGLRPQVYYYMIHFGRWPRPYHYHPELGLEPPRVLLDSGDWSALSLTSQQVTRKYEGILFNRTQLTTRHYFLVAFARANEIFSDMPVPTIPTVPAGVPLDWRKAVKNKVIKFTPADTAHKLGGHTVEVEEPESITLEDTSFLRQGDELIAQIVTKNRLGRRTGIHLMLFGYKNGSDFAHMPKIRVHIRTLGGTRVYDGSKRLRDEVVKVKAVGNRMFVRVPLRLLGEEVPDFLFTSTRAHLGEITPDDTAWRLFSLSNEPVVRHTIGKHQER